MNVRICEVSFHLTNCRTRIPFRFGINTMTAAPLCVCRVLIEAERGERCEGFSSDLLVPKWFEKNPDQSIEDDWRRLCSSARAAANDALAEPAPATVFAHWQRIYESRVGGAPPGATDLLVRGEGVSLVERALIDAACRVRQCSFPAALREDVLGLHVDPTLKATVDSLDLPLRFVAVRHTVGLVDALTEGDVAADRRVDDGLPASLEEDIERYGLSHFKLKVSGEIEADLDRLRRIGNVLRARVKAEPLLTLDGNEQFESIVALDELIQRMRNDETLAWMLGRIAYIEQPLARPLSAACGPEPTESIFGKGFARPET